MMELVIPGKQRIEGSLRVQGAKNMVLPILCSCLLIEEPVTLHNCPVISDVEETLQMLRLFGVKTERNGHTIICNAAEAGASSLTGKPAKGNRMSILMMGAMLSRFGSGKITYPGGCPIGKRPVNLHEEVFRHLGASLGYTEDGMEGVCGKMKGCRIALPFPSVGATENAVICGCLAAGTTEIHGAAMEPEVAGLCLFLRQCGADVSGIGTAQITIHGVEKLHGCTYTMEGDRIVAGTYLAAAAVTGGECEVTGISPHYLSSFLDLCAELGCGLYLRKDSVFLKAPERLQADIKIRTEPYPGFPTDLQPLAAVMCAKNRGNSEIEETIFENRFDALNEMKKFGAEIQIVPPKILVYGKHRLHSAVVSGRDLRGTAALVVLALAAEGESRIRGIEVISRGYEDIMGDLARLGCKEICVETE